MNLDFAIPNAGGAYQRPQTTVDFWIRDLIQGSPVVTPATFNINENLAIGASVGAVTYSDPDSDPVTWSIRSGNTGGAFAINSSTGAVTVAAALDYRTLSNYSLLVRATDPSGLYGEAAIAINLTSTAPVITPATFSIFEALGIGSAVGTLAFTDPDDSSVTWSIQSGNAGGAFSITSSTGILKVASALDYATHSGYTLVVRATDPGGRYGEANIAIAIKSSKPAVTPATFTIAENLGLGASVGTMSFSDPDDSTTTWSITSGNIGSAFSIDSVTGVITVAAALDFKTKNSYTLVMRATDPGGRYAEGNATINLTSTAPVVTAATFAIDEDVAIGVDVGTLAFTDVDDASVTWSIRSGNTGTAFSLNGVTGLLEVASTLDYRTKNTYTLVVRATDPGGRWGEANIVVNLNSTAPVVTPATFTVGENAAPGTVVGAVVATDPHGDPDIVFAITSGNTAGAFAIDGVTGEITVALALDYETKPTYALTVLATDSTGRWGAGTITVNLIDQIDIFLPPAPALILGLKTLWGKSSGALDSEQDLPFVSMQPLDHLASEAWTRLRLLDSGKTLPWQGMEKLDAGEALLWARNSAADNAAGLPWISRVPRDIDPRLMWNGAMRPIDAQLEADWKDLAINDKGATVVFTSFDATASEGTWFDPPQAIQDGVDIRISWRAPGFDFNIQLTDAYSLPQATLDFSIADLGPFELGPPVAIRWAPIRVPTFRPHAVDSITSMPWDTGHPIDKSDGFKNKSLNELPGAGVDLPWNNDPPDHDEIVVPPLKVYNVMNSISVVRLPERTVINPIGLQLDYDDSTFCWTGKLVLASAAEVNLLKPTPFTKREIEVNVNGFVVVLSIQTRARERKFPSKTWTLQAKGRQAYLADPYVRPRSLISDELKSAAQFALDELPDGWTMDWNIPDWNIPAGVWSYDQLTPIQAIGRLAAAAGGLIQPDAEDQHIVVRSRYPVSPVQWYTVTPDISLPAELCTTISDSDQPGQLRNQVIVEASRAPGRRTICTRAGTGGEDPMPSVTEELNTSVLCGQERGRVELDGSGPWIDQAIAIPILASLGVVLPGKLLEATEDGDAWRGLTRGISIVAQRVDSGWGIGQTLRIERREAA